MSQSQRECERTFVAAEDMSSAQYHLVKFGSGDNEVDLCDTQGEAAFGVLQGDPASGEAALVRYAHTTKVVAGGAISKGAAITAGADARAEESASGDVEVGIALEAAAADGDIIEVLLTQHRNVTS